MPKILVTDDEPDICRLIRRYAEHDGFKTVGVADGAEAVALCKKEQFDIIVMDIMMPIMDGYAASRKIREFSDVPILMLSARGEEYDKLFGFEVGIDDYVIKPFSPKELMARINAIVRRRGGITKAATDTEPLCFAGLEINITGREIRVYGEKTNLTPKEFDLLLYLARHNGIVLTRDQILNAVWGYDYYGEDRAVDWQVKLLRNKLGECRDMIRTIRGVGYKFDA